MSQRNHLAALRAREAHLALLDAHYELERAQRANARALEDIGEGATVLWRGRRHMLLGLAEDDGVPRVRLAAGTGTIEVPAGQVEPVCPDHVCPACGIEMDADLPLCLACDDDSCGECGRPPSDPCLCEGQQSDPLTLAELGFPRGQS